jgi:topoisomerase-4 subunit A
MYVITNFDFSTHFDDKMISVEKWDSERPVSVVYYDGEKTDWFVKRFLPENSSKPVSFIGDNKDSKLAFATSLYHPQARVKYNRRFKHTRDREDELIDMRGFIALKGVRALGNKLSSLPITEVLLEPANVELEAAVAAEVQEARRADDVIEASVVASVEVDNDVLSDEHSSDEAPESDDLPIEDPKTDGDGQASLF